MSSYFEENGIKLKSKLNLNNNEHRNSIYSNLNTHDLNTFHLNGYTNNNAGATNTIGSYSGKLEQSLVDAYNGVKLSHYRPVLKDPKIEHSSFLHPLPQPLLLNQQLNSTLNPPLITNNNHLLSNQALISRPLITNELRLNRPVISNYPSAVESALVNSSRPLASTSDQLVNVNGQNGLLLNGNELRNWNGPPLNNYRVNDDPNPEVIRKKPIDTLNYVQDIHVRYLKPPTPPPPGDIVVTQEQNRIIPPAPPVVIRQIPPRPNSPTPIIFREAPPPPPPRVPQIDVTVPGRVIAPPARKVVIERLPIIPQRPPTIIVERWLPYDRVNRRVIVNKTEQIEPIVADPKNVLIEWDTPDVNVSRRVIVDGLYRAEPGEYFARFGRTLIPAENLPCLANQVPRPNGVPLAAESREYFDDVRGDLQVLKKLGLNCHNVSSVRVGSQFIHVNPEPLLHRLVPANEWAYNCPCVA